MKKYNLTVRKLPHKLRNGRQTAEKSSNAGITTIEGGIITAEKEKDENSHTHTNKGDLDKLRADGDDYIYVTQPHGDDDEVTTNKAKAGYADEAGALSPESATRKEFISRLQDDVAKGKITFEQMTKMLGLSVMGGIHSGDAKGTDTYREGGIEGSGFGIYTDASGETHVEADNIVARKRFTVNVLEIQKETFTGGNFNLTDANGTVFRVYALNDGGMVRASVFAARGKDGKMWAITLTDAESQDLLVKSEGASPIWRPPLFYKLYFTREDNGQAVKDMWRNGDMALVKTLNLDRGQRYWHRVVTAHGTEVLEDGKEYNYIVVANNASDNGITVTSEDGTRTSGVVLAKAAGSAEPQAGDQVVQYGSVLWPSRQGMTKLKADGEGYGGMTVEEGIGESKGIAEQFSAKRTPIEICPKRIHLTADEFRICTRDSAGNITGDAEPTTYRLTAKEFASAADASAGTCTTTFGLMVSEDKMSGSHTMTGADLMAAGFNLRAKLEGREWKKLPIESTAETHYDGGIFTDYPYIGDNKPKSMQCELYRETDEVVAAISFPIVVNGADGTSFNIKEQVAPKIYATMTEIEAETKLPTFWYLVHKNDKVSPASFHWIYKNPGGAFQANLGDCYIENHYGHIYTAVEDGWLDIGAMKGVDGTDGKDAVVMEMTPAQLIITETEKNAGYKDLDKHVKVMFRKGEEETAPVIQSIEATNCTASSANNEFWLTGVSDNVKECRCVITATDGTITITRSYDIYVNRLGTWEMTAKNDTMKSVSQRTFTYLDENGQAVTQNGLSTIEQNAGEISLKVDELNDGLAATGIDIKKHQVEVTTQNLFVKNEQGQPTFLVDANGKVSTKLINAADIVTEGLQAKTIKAEQATIEDINLMGSSRIGGFGIMKETPWVMHNIDFTWTDEAGTQHQTTWRDTNLVKLTHESISFDYFNSPGEGSYRYCRFGHTLGDAMVWLQETDRSGALGQRNIQGIYIDVPPTPAENVDNPNGWHDDAIYIKHGTVCGWRPRLRRVEITGRNQRVDLTKEDYTVLVTGTGSAEIYLPPKDTIDDGQRVEIRFCDAIPNTINADAALSNGSRVEHNQMKIYIWDKKNQKWWVNSLN